MFGLYFKKTLKSSPNAISVVAGVVILLSSATASAVPFTLSSGPKQHGVVQTTSTATPPTTGSYRIETELRIQSPHVVDRPHPYPNPAIQTQHHHAIEPTGFNFTERYFVTDTGDIGSEAAILAGKPLTTTGNPYSSTYELTLDVEGNAWFVLDNGHSWTGNIGIPSQGGGLNSFGFSVSVLGSGGSLQFGWDNPSTAPFTMNFTGDVDNPKFSFVYADAFSMNKATLAISGWVQNEDIDVFGRVLSDGWATILEDVTILGNVGVRGYLLAPVYDVTHGKVSAPGTAVLFILGIVFLFGRHIQSAFKSNSASSLSRASIRE